MWNQYANMAVQYYLAARFSAAAGHLPVSGNLMHHAVELQLKCGLIKVGAVPPAPKPPNTLDRALKHHYGHALPKLWRDFKVAYPVADLAMFDDLLERLDAWEEIRYPQLGVAMLVQASGSSANEASMDLRGSTLYTLHMREIDKLFQRLWSTVSINPEYFRSLSRSNVPVVASVYETDNAYMIYG